MYNHEKVEKATFALLLPYLEGLKGGARERAVKLATDIVEIGGAYTKVGLRILRVFKFVQI